MSYIGSSAAVVPVAFSGVNSESFNGDGSTVAFTLNRPVSSVKAIEVVVNNVQQSPYDGSYSVSSTTLTFSAAPSSGTANIYVVYRDFPVGSITDTGAVQKTGDTMTGNLIVDANVGIGTSSPANKLHTFSGSSTATVAKFAATNYGNAGTTYIEIGTQYGDGGSRIGNINPSGNLGTLVFETMTGTSGVFAERLRIDSDGLKFNGDTSAANALDDYEEGAFNFSSVTFQTSGSATINNQTNSYTKIGNLVTCIMFVNVTFGSGCAGHMFFNGLPFVPIAISEAVMTYNNQSAGWTKDGNMFTNTNSTIVWYERGYDPSNISNFNMWLQTTYMTTA